ncbi:MAG: (d)CMP kinase [Microbacterium sp.]|uniref:(d)CMP kinase n=1 Tax=Microbacterium sp. TaxID=51671 RepID=UPI003A8B6888
MTSPRLVIAMDGPAGSGKSSVAKEVARRRGYGYLDTGAVYRALAWHVLARAADTADENAVMQASDDFHWTISLDPDAFWVRVGDTDVTADIREPRVSDAVSGVARVPAVRTAVNEAFRALAATVDTPGIVIEGRDITTVVAPDAPVRVLLTAAPDVRAARRSGELTNVDAAAVAAALHRRDASDSQVVDFLVAAPGVAVVDSTELDLEQAVQAVLALLPPLSEPVEETS